MRELTIVVGGQFGSEGKGAVIGHIAQHLSEKDLVIRVGGPNAGHTVVGGDGRTFKLRQIPAAVVDPLVNLHIAAGSEIDPEVLYSEMRELDDGPDPIDVRSRLTISPHATLLTQDHVNAERSAELASRLGSTGKGIGAARAARIMRYAVPWGQYAANYGWSDITGERNIAEYRHIVIEGTQGYGLGLHTGYYPFTTSGDCTALDFLTQARVSPWSAQLDRMTVWVVVRAFPIRVAGNSGPLHAETTWERLGLPQERTTVTNKVRRVGRWDSSLVAEAVRANGGHPVVRLALMMADQQFPQIKGCTDEDELGVATGFAFNQWVESIEQDCGAQVGLVGTGPDTCVWIRED